MESERRAPGQRSGGERLDGLRGRWLPQYRRAGPQLPRCARCRDRRGDGLEPRGQLLGLLAGIERRDDLCRRELHQHRWAGAQRHRGDRYRLRDGNRLEPERRWTGPRSGAERFDGLRGRGLTNVGGQARNHIAAIDAITGAVRPWNPNAGLWVRALVVNGSTVYAGGAFTTMDGSMRSYFAAINQATTDVPGGPGGRPLALRLD